MKHKFSDLDGFIALYKSIGIDLVVNDDGDEKYVALHENYDASVQNTSSPKFEGYGGFHSIINFTKDGEFISQGFWE